MAAYIFMIDEIAATKRIQYFEHSDNTVLLRPKLLLSHIEDSSSNYFLELIISYNPTSLDNDNHSCDKVLRILTN